MPYNKFRVAPKAERILNGKIYASKKEKTFAQKLELLKSAKDPKERVVAVEEQVTYRLEANGVKICDYRLDFKVTYADNRIVYYDCKGYTKGTAYGIFKLKKNLMRACLGIDVVEV